jgi:hypothetical protein
MKNKTLARLLLAALMSLSFALGLVVPDKPQQFIVASDNATEYSDAQMDSLEQQRLEDIDNLMNSTEDRDEELWDEMGVDEELTVKDYEEVEEEDRDLEWTLGLAGIAVASQTQFFLDNREQTLLKPLAYREQLMSGFKLTPAQMRIAGKRGVLYISDTKFKALQTKWLNETAFLREMSNTELYNALLDAGALRPTSQMITDSMQYVSRLTSYKPGTPQFKAALNDLIAKDSKRAVVSMNRRSVERIYTARQIDGDETTPMAWIVEGGPSTCSECVVRAGQIRTYAQWEATGLPGEEVCLGGGRCRCHLEAVGA